MTMLRIVNRRPVFQSSARWAYWALSLVQAGCGEGEFKSSPTASSTSDVSSTTASTNDGTAQTSLSATAVSSTSVKPTTTTATSSSAANTSAQPSDDESVTQTSRPASTTAATSTGQNVDSESEEPDSETSSAGNDSTAPSVNPDSTQPRVESMPSAGCSGGSSDAMVANSVVDKPDGYDGSNPVPVLFAFHGAGGNPSSLQGPFASDAKSRGYLGVYLKSKGSAWSPRDDEPGLDAAFETIAENYCVDLNRVFAVGHSSGAQMITQLLCAGESRFRAVAPVASSKYCNGWDATAAIVIHGVDDIERGGQGENRYQLDDGDGHKDFAVYHDSNQCTDVSTAFEPGGDCGPDIHPGCVEFDDCAARTVFCNHDDPQYGTSNHGVPCFASPVMFDFFDAF